MKEIGYGKGYRYAHDQKDGTAGMTCLPDKLAGTVFYAPRGHGYEKNILERMEWVRSKRDKS